MLEKLKLKRPLAFIDLETTGTSYYNDRIVEFSVLKVWPDGTEEYKSRRVNPEMPIPTDATNVHGISDSDVEDAPTFRQLAKGILEFIEGCDLAGFNILDFDLPLLESEYERVGIEFSRGNRQIVDPMVIYHKMVPYNPESPRNLEAAYLYYCGKGIKDAHSAEGDVRTCAEVLEGQLEMYDELPGEVGGLCSICSAGRENYIDKTGKFVWIENEASFNFGKHKGRMLRAVVEENPDYFEWILSQDFAPEVISIVTNALRGIFPERE